jgi:phage tail protein X
MAGANGKQQALTAFAARAPDHMAQLAAALTAAPHDPDLIIADAAAGAEQGRANPFARIEAVLAANPGWAEGHYRLAQLRIEFGEDAPLAPIEAALAARPDDPKLWHHYLVLLSAQDRHAEAAAHTAALRRRIGNVPGLCLLEARYAGLAGEAARAAPLLDGLPDQLPDLGYQRVRNALQRGAVEQAEQLLAAMPLGGDMRLWALAELTWRATGNPRHQQLLPDNALAANRLVTTFDLGLDEDTFAQTCATLWAMHRARSAPPSQSLRGGTQTRGQLHLRDAPALAPLFAGFRAGIAAYAKSLSLLGPLLEPAHPLARIASQVPVITASWSVRLTGGGFHIPHIHSEGLLSSACHLVVPDGAREPDREGAGALELGRPPPDIALALAPLARFAPVPQRLVLFPSFLYHATAPFAAGERLTAVFDAA